MAESRFKDFVELAIKKEIEAAEMYEKYAGTAASEATRSMLEEMARMERGHEAKLRVFLQTGLAYFSRIGVIEDLHIAEYLEPPAIGENASMQDIMVFAMKAEQKAFDMYNRFEQLELDAQSKKLFGALAAEEKMHKHDLEQAYEREFMTEN